MGLVLGLVSTGLVRPRLVKASRVPSGSTITLITAQAREESHISVCVCVCIFQNSAAGDIHDNMCGVTLKLFFHPLQF